MLTGFEIYAIRFKGDGAMTGFAVVPPEDKDAYTARLKAEATAQGHPKARVICTPIYDRGKLAA